MPVNDDHAELEPGPDQETQKPFVVNVTGHRPDPVLGVECANEGAIAGQFPHVDLTVVAAGEEDRSAVPLRARQRSDDARTVEE
ncbi:hypothetical protein [Streptomyces rishiriensis]|uniref:hypothetical protein n=1 Tax=Streptomyces rishiriensis TaxID=68264 RepID=UPI0037CE339B